MILSLEKLVIVGNFSLISFTKADLVRCIRTLLGKDSVYHLTEVGDT
jgi:hypothetical protein